MTTTEFRASILAEIPPAGLTVPVEALWWDAKGDWIQAHNLVDNLETPDGMAVHAYLHRKSGEASNAEYWYRLAGTKFRRDPLEAEWEALVDGLLTA